MDIRESLVDLLKAIEPEEKAIHDANDCIGLLEAGSLGEAQIRGKLIALQQSLGLDRAAMETIWTVLGLEYTDSAI